MRHARLIALLVALGGAVACYAAVTPRVVAVVRPYVPVIVIDNPAGVTWLGQTRCDAAGNPYILVNPQQSDAQMSGTLLHERVHVADAERFGCRAFVARYMADSMFRLEAEALAFCAVLQTQLALGESPMPPFKTIVWVLHARYLSDYTAEAVEAATASCR